MQADELDCRARLRARCRAVIRDLRELGVPDERMRSCTLLELEELRFRAYRHLMTTPKEAA